MKRKRKKVLLFIVEGMTEQTAFSGIFKNIFKDTGIVFRVMSGDITTSIDRRSNIVNEMNDQIKNEMKRYGYRKEDMLKVFHIIDTDGAFIPDDSVICHPKDTVEYTEEQILCPDIDRILSRNHRKRQSVLILKSKSIIGGIPYRILYMSRNMEHVLHNEGGNLSQDEKIDLADEFSDRFSEDSEGFKTFIRSSDFAVLDDYQATWKYIMIDRHSLKRHSNLHLILEEEEIQKELGEE